MAINGDKIIKNDANALNDSAYNIIVLYITNNGAITNGEAQELLGLKASRSRDILKAMTQLGLIVKEGDKKSTKYILPE